MSSAITLSGLSINRPPVTVALVSAFVIVRHGRLVECWLLILCTLDEAIIEPEAIGIEPPRIAHDGNILMKLAPNPPD
jgi:hypothetical protein